MGNVFRISNPDSAATGNYDQTHPSSPAIDQAGETGTGAPNQRFTFSFDFMAASNAEQDGLRVDVTPFESGTASRQGILRIQDGGTDGFRIGWWEYGTNWNFLTLGTNLARDMWHSIAVDMLFNDGPMNDTVEILLNGTATAATTWEGYYRDQQPSTVQPEFAPVDSVIFRVEHGCGILGTGACTNVAGQGIYFDNFSQASAPAAVPVPATAALMGVGLAVLGFARRRTALN
jgi:hypothetical protein